jgi:uncharacterized protein (TIGR03546 family)
MIVFQTARRLMKILNSELTPTQVAVGLCFGVMAGLAPFGPNSILLFALALLFNCSFSATLLAFGIFKLLSFLLAPLSYFLGKTVLDGLAPLDPLWNQVFHWPILALMDYSRYLTFGSYVLALLFSVPLFYLARRLIWKYRTVWVESLESKLGETRAYRALQRRGWLLRLILWAVGGQVYFRDAPDQRLFFRVVRKHALWAVPLLAILVFVPPALIIPFVINNIVAQAATYVIGGRVEVPEARFNSLTGRLAVRQLIVQNPSRKEENILVARDLVFDMDLPALASKRLVINEASIGEILFNIRREADGSLNISHLETGQDLSPHYDWLLQEAQKVDWIELVRRYLEARLNSPRRDELAPYAGRRELPGSAPAFVLEKLKIGRVHLTLTDEFQTHGELPSIRMVDLLINDLSWNAKLAQRPIQVTVNAALGGAPDSAIRWSALFDEGQSHREFRLELQQIDLAALRVLYEKSLPVRIVQGVITLTSQGTVDAGEVRGRVQLVVEGLRLVAPENFSLFGLGGAASQSVLDGINYYAQRCPIVMDFPLSGRWEAPHFEVEGPLLEIARQGLIWAGRSALLSGPLSEIAAKLKELQASSGLPVMPPGADPLQTLLQQLLQQKGRSPASCGIRQPGA